MNQKKKQLIIEQVKIQLQRGKAEENNKNKIKEYNEQPLPSLKEGMTLDKYFGCTFTVVNQEKGFKFDKEFGKQERIQSKHDESIQQYLEDEFEINEIDEDLYTESNCENTSVKNSKNQKRRTKQKSRHSPMERQDQIALEIPVNNEIQQKIINKYQKKKNRSIHRPKPEDKFKISIKIEYPQNNFYSQNIQKNNLKKQNEDSSSYTLNHRNHSNSKEKNHNNDSFDAEYDNHIVLRNTSCNIFRYSNYKNFQENEQNPKHLNTSQNKFFNKFEDNGMSMPKIYYDNHQIKHKYQKQRESIDRKMQHQDQIMIDKYAQRFNLNQEECSNLSENKSYRFRNYDNYKRQQNDQDN